MLVLVLVLADVESSLISSLSRSNTNNQHLPSDHERIPTPRRERGDSIDVDGQQH